VTGRGEGARRFGGGFGGGGGGRRHGIAGAARNCAAGVGALLRGRFGSVSKHQPTEPSSATAERVSKRRKTRPDLVDERTVTYADSALSH
jgi:hypothetical protein